MAEIQNRDETETWMIEEWILYYIRDQDSLVPTSNIIDRFPEIKPSTIRSKLTSLRDEDLVEANKINENSGAANATNYYKFTEKGAEYIRENDLSIPNYEKDKRLKKKDKRLENWIERDDNWKDIAEKRIKALETRADEKDGEIEQLKERVKELEDS